MRSSQYACTHVRAEKCTHSRQITYVEIVFSIPKRTALKGKNSLPLGANSFLKEKSPILKRDATDENHSSF